jgi:seryl-tRNA synthetase
MATNHQNIVSEKDKLLVEYQKQIDALQRAEQELSKQIEEQKVKNNVSTHTNRSLKFPLSPISTQTRFLNLISLN